MFSTLDHSAYRGVDIVIDADNRSEALEIPPSLEEMVARAAACPADWLLRRLADDVASRERRHQREIDRVTLSVWRADFSPITLLPTERTLRTFVRDVR